MTSTSQSPGKAGFSAGPPDAWSLEDLERNWSDFLGSLIEESGPNLPAKRVRRQVEQTPAYRDITARWPKMTGPQRLDAWKSLLAAAERAAQDILPACVQCGECCRRGSPVLHVDDLDLLRGGKIAWSRLVALRTGEPVRLPIGGKIFDLPDERIKVREKEGSAECVFLEAASDLCSIYGDRPVECRAQACWDPAQAFDAAKLPYLARKEIFAGVELLLEMISEHDSRCSFASLKEAFARLDETRGESVGEVLEMLSYEDHFRGFISERFNIPADTLDLVFGRSFAELVPVFGFKVVVEPGGAKCLVPDGD